MKFFYLIECIFKSPNHQIIGHFTNLGFKTEKEARDFCRFQSDFNNFYCYRKITIGKYKKK